MLLPRLTAARLGIGAALLAGLAMAAPTHAAEPGYPVRNAGELAVLCAAKAPDIHYAAKENFCHGFAQGVVSAELERARAAGPGAVRPFCVTSASPSRAVTLKDFVKWIDANPVHKSEPAAAILVKFMGERLPCKPPAGKS